MTKFSFTLQIAAETVEVSGTWDKYICKTPLSKNGSSRGICKWEGILNANLQCGERYWYQFIIDGNYQQYNPDAPFIELADGVVLNILDIPNSSSTEIALGRPLLSSQILSPVPRNLTIMSSLLHQFSPIRSPVPQTPITSPQLQSSQIQSPVCRSSLLSLDKLTLDECSCERYYVLSNGQRIKASCNGLICGECDEDDD